MTIEEVLQHDLKFRYMLLGRLQADCRILSWLLETKVLVICGLVLKRHKLNT